MTDATPHQHQSLQAHPHRENNIVLDPAAALKAEILAAAASITAEGIAMIAADTAEANESEYAAALEEIRGELLTPLAMVVQVSEKLAVALKAEAESLQPMLHAATVRAMQIGQRLDEIPQCMKMADAIVKDAQKRYIASGLTHDEALRLTEPKRTEMDASIQALQEEEAALRAELEPLKHFTSSRKRDDIPEGFEIPAPVEKVSSSHAC